MGKENRGKTQHRLTLGKKILIIIAVILAIILLSIAVIAIISKVSADALLVAVSKVEPISYESDIIRPIIDDETGKPKVSEDGVYTFVDSEDLLSKRNFRVLQITDIHIGAGAFSARTDAWTIKTVEDMIKREQPDLVVVTGDIAYPVPFQAGTMNNRNSAEIFADLMERIGVYWTLTFGNHDTEAYSYFSREDIGKLYASDKYKYCLFDNSVKTLSDGTKVYGVGNFAINVLDSKGDSVHTLFMVDSNSYRDNDPLGLQWQYDMIHEDQIRWYEEVSTKLGIVDREDMRSTMYFHIPPHDFVDMVTEWNETGDSNTIAIRDGKMGEFIVTGSVVSNSLYDSLVSHNSSGIFVGHDHKNNASYWYDKDGFDNGERGLRFTYGMSIDYLAYPGIYKETDQRGGRMIEINSIDRLRLCDDIADKIYDTSHFEEDRGNGFYSYRVPYWRDLYRSK